MFHQNWHSYSCIYAWIWVFIVLPSFSNSSAFYVRQIPFAYCFFFHKFFHIFSFLLPILVCWLDVRVGRRNIVITLYLFLIFLSWHQDYFFLFFFSHSLFFFESSIQKSSPNFSTLCYNFHSASPSCWNVLTTVTNWVYVA